MTVAAGWPGALTRRRAAALAAALAAVVHLGALANGFAYDDEVVVAGDADLRSLSTLGPRLLEPYWPDAFGASVGSWRPVTTAAFGLLWVGADGRPWAFHAAGVALHAVATGLVVLFLAALLPPVAALAGGLLFSVHPVHVEAVANVVGMAEPLAAVFALAAAVWWVRSDAPPGTRAVVGMAVLYGLAVLAKEGAAVLPGLLILADAARRDLGFRDVGAYLRRRGAALAAMAAALALCLVARWSVLGTVTSPTHPPGAEVLSEIPRIWTLAAVWPHWVRLLVAPVDLASDYAPGVVEIAYGWTPAGVVGVGVALAALLVAWAAWRQGEPMGPDRPSPRTLGFAVVWVLVAVLPVANVLFLAPTILAERTLYLASIGAAAAFGWGVAEVVRRRPPVGWAALAVALVAFTALSLARVPTWRSSDAVFETLLDDHPESGRAWWGLARRLDRAGQVPEARRAYAVAMDLLDSEHQVALDVGAHLLSTGRPEQARLFLRRTWRARSDWYTAPGLLAAAELGAGRPAVALEAARAAVALAPSNPSMHHLHAQALAALGRHGEAADARRASLAAGFSDRWRSWLLLAGDLGAAGDTTAALSALDSAGARTDDTDATDEIGQARRALSPPSS